MASVTLRLLLDHNVPVSVAHVFEEHGHDVFLVRDVLPVDSPDPLVATFSEGDGLILVSCDRDFQLIAPRIPKGARARFRRLSRIVLQCNEPQAAERVRAAMSLIESEYQIALKSGDTRMIVVIQNAGIKTHR